MEKWLDLAHITLNKNAIPNDPEKPFITSGVRIGTPAVTTRGMKEPEMVEIGNLIADIVESKGEAIEAVKAKVIALTDRFPIYKDDIID